MGFTKHQYKYVYFGYHVTKYAEYQKLLSHQTKHPFIFKQYFRIFVILKIVHIFTDVSDQLYVSVLSHHFFLQFSQIGSNTLNRYVCIYL